MVFVSQFQGQVAVVTGAAGGIGAALSHQLAGHGARLALVDCNADAVHELATELGSQHLPIVQDLSSIEALPALIAHIRDSLGPIDVLINNAGLTVHGPFTEQTPQDIDRVLDVDLRSVMHLTHSVLPDLLANRGHLVFVSSMAGLYGFPMQSTYSGAKFGVRGFSQALRAEVGSKGVSVTTVLPGTVATPFLSNAGSVDEEMSTVLARLMQRYGTSPDYVARKVLKATKRRRSEVRIGWDCVALGLLGAFMPWMLPWGLKRGMG